MIRNWNPLLISIILNIGPGPGPGTLRNTRYNAGYCRLLDQGVTLFIAIQRACLGPSGVYSMTSNLLGLFKFTCEMLKLPIYLSFRRTFFYKC